MYTNSGRGSRITYLNVAVKSKKNDIHQHATKEKGSNVHSTKYTNQACTFRQLGKQLYYQQSCPLISSMRHVTKIYTLKKVFVLQSTPSGIVYGYRVLKLAFALPDL